MRFLFGILCLFNLGRGLLLLVPNNSALFVDLFVSYQEKGDEAMLQPLHVAVQKDIPESNSMQGQAIVKEQHPKTPTNSSNTTFYTAAKGPRRQTVTFHAQGIASRTSTRMDVCRGMCQDASTDNEN